jgi:lysyl-tRNA synthetase class 2
MLNAARQFFHARHVLEVETPQLSLAANSDPQIESVPVRIRGREPLYWLHTSPEFAMKRLLAAGSGDIFQICKVFRDGEIGRWHNPEFTLLEWYRQEFDDDALMREVEQLAAALLAPERILPPAIRMTYGEALRRHAGIDIDCAADVELAAAAERAGVHCEAALDRDARLDLLMGCVVGPQLGRKQPCFIHDYPASQASLAQLKPRPEGGAPTLAARFEFYIDGLELANGFHELGDASQQRARFEADLRLRAERRQPLPPIDERLLDALAHGLPDCAGVALGFDRLLALAVHAGGLAEVLSFNIENA